MTQSPPKASTSSRPPAAATVVDAGRLMTALAAGGSVLLLSMTAVALWPRTYGTEATLVIDGGARIDNPVALAGRIEAALLEREQLASAAMELPPELRSPDPIGRLRAGISVQSRGALGFAVEFRGSNPPSVQRIANRLADRAVAMIPKLTASPEDAAPLKELAARSRAVSEFLSAHPEVTVEQPSDKSAPTPSSDSALELLRTEKRQIEQKLAAHAAADNPYADPDDDPVQLNRRLAELKNTITKREAALAQPRAASPPAASQELTARWRTLLTELTAAQAKAAAPAGHALVTAHVSARAPLPTSPLTPNRLVLSIVALLLSLAAAMVAYILPRKATLLPRAAQHRGRSDPPPAPGMPQRPRSDPPPAARPRSDPPPAARPRSDPPPAAHPRSDPPPAAHPGSEPPGPMAPQRTVVLTSAARAPAEPAAEKRSHTAPGGLEAPSAVAQDALAATAVAAPPARSSPPPSAAIFGSRPPPGAGSYSVSSSHPPPYDRGAGNARTSVERLSPLQSSHPPLPPNNPIAAGVFDARHPSPPPADGPQILSKPPALNPEAERWAARFEKPPPATEVEPTPRKQGRWKTQAMGSMVPLEVSTMREERPPPSEAPVSVEDRLIVPAQQPRAAPEPLHASANIVHHDVPAGWRPGLDPADPQVLRLRDAVLAQGLSRRLRIAVTGSADDGKAQIACGLALALAQSGARVLLLEADFDHPRIHQTLAIDPPGGAGFSQQIMTRLHGNHDKPWVLMRCSASLLVLAEGRFRSPGLVASSGFERAVAELGQAHHVLVIHAPALSRTVELRAIDAVTQAAVIAQDAQPATIHFGENPLRSVLGS